MVPEPEIDRLSPCRRPPGPCLMYQKWSWLLFLHWEVPAEALRPRIPEGLEVDTYEGRAFVGLVPFTMSGIRPRGFPAVRALSDFHETNVRTYVHRRGRDPGVWFFSLDAAQPVAARLGRWLYRLPYSVARMSLDGKAGRGEPAEPDGRWIRHETERLSLGPVPAHARVAYRPTGSPSPAIPGTLEHFLAERYLLYDRGPGGRLLTAAVHHAPYPLQGAEVAECDENLIASAGIVRPDTPPPLAHFARSVSVEVFPIRPVR
ncbi:MAG: DUF2071 domain-containing protein [Isosphaeraceae bacterium]